MIRDKLPSVLAIAALLSLGVLITRVWMHSPNDPIEPALSTALVLRPLDLIVQLGLMLVCALGIRALLPGDHEQEETTDEDYR